MPHHVAIEYQLSPAHPAGAYPDSTASDQRERAPQRDGIFVCNIMSTRARYTHRTASAAPLRIQQEPTSITLQGSPVGSREPSGTADSCYDKQGKATFIQVDAFHRGEVYRLAGFESQSWQAGCEGG